MTYTEAWYLTDLLKSLNMFITFFSSRSEGGNCSFVGRGDLLLLLLVNVRCGSGGKSSVPASNRFRSASGLFFSMTELFSTAFTVLYAVVVVVESVAVFFVDVLNE